MTIADLPNVMGGILIVAGVVQVFVQMWLRRDAPVPPSGFRGSQSADFRPDGFKVQTAYPGVTMICVGALLLLLGETTTHVRHFHR